MSKVSNSCREELGVGDQGTGRKEDKDPERKSNLGSLRVFFLSSWSLGLVLAWGKNPYKPLLSNLIKQGDALLELWLSLELVTSIIGQDSGHFSQKKRKRGRLHQWHQFSPRLSVILTSHLWLRPVHTWFQVWFRSRGNLTKVPQSEMCQRLDLTLEILPFSWRKQIPLAFQEWEIRGTDLTEVTD